MTKRVVLAAVLGSIAMFAWVSVAHMVLPLGETGVQEITNNEAAVLTAMQSGIGNSSGFYVFPGTGLGPNATHEQREAAMGQYDAKLASNPSGILIYHPPGTKFMMTSHLITEFLTEFAEAFLVVFLLSQAKPMSFAGRVGFVTIAGVIAAIATNVSYWNWYGFPTNYTAAYILIQVVGFFCVGVVAALVMKGGAAKQMTAAA
jgi:hypothetical protein